MIRVVFGEESDDDAVGADEAPGLVILGQLGVLQTLLRFSSLFTNYIRL